jgi:hypothetical protein
MPAWEDLDQFLDPDDFGVLAQVTTQAGAVRSIHVLFDDPAVGLKADRRNLVGKTASLGSYDADDETPSMVGKASDLEGITRRDLVQIEGRSYGVLTGPRPEGTGLARVELTLEP